MDEAGIEQRFQHHVHTASVIHVLRHIFAAGLEVRDVGRRLEDLGHIEQVELHAAFVGHRRQMQRAVGGTTGGRHDPRCILERFARADIARADVALQQGHDLLARRNRDIGAAAIGRRRHVAVGQRKPDGFAHTGHGVGGILPAARAMAGACHLLQRRQPRNRAVAGRKAAHRLEHVHHGHILVFKAAREDRSTVNEDARHVQPQHRHHHARQALVAPGKAQQRIITMAAHRQFNTVGNAIAGNQRRLHALVSHGNPVGHRDGVEPPRHPAGFVHPDPRCIGLRIQRGVTRRRVIPRRSNPHERPPDFLLGQPHRVIITAMRRPLRPH